MEPVAPFFFVQPAAHPTSAWALLRVVLACLACAGGSGQAGAQYKVVGPDGKITYTDKPVAERGAQVQPVRQAGGPSTAPGGTPAWPLPADLRLLVERFPVTLYTSSDCAPCESARKLLQQRGVPYAERSVANDDDIAALQRLTGGRSAPSLTVGAQALRGFLEADWQGLLDLAGYPRESRLPRNYPATVAAPLVARSLAPKAAPLAEAPAGAAPEPVEAAAPRAIRF